jgi:hypothetical protein
VKTALSIICSLAFVWAQIAACAQTPQAAAAKPDCGCGGRMACCAVHHAPVSPPLAASPAPAGNQNQLSVPPQNIAAWVLPDAAISQFPSASPISFVTEASPLYSRNCAWLI